MRYAEAAEIAALVACSRCGSARGVRCKAHHGEPLQTVHAARVAEARNKARPEKHGASASAPPSDEELSAMLDLVKADLDPERAKSLLMRLVLQAQLQRTQLRVLFALDGAGRSVFRMDDWNFWPEPQRHSYEALRTIART